MGITKFVKKAVKTLTHPFGSLISQGADLVGETIKGLVPEMPQMPAPPTAAPPPPPDVAVAADRARLMRQQEDAQRRKRGRASTVLTGPEGVGSTPVGVKTLVGS